MPKHEKVTAVSEIKELFEQSGSFFVTDYQGLNVADISVLRKQLRDNQVKYLVAKNTLFRIAAHEAGVPNVDEHFKGPTAVAFVGRDAAAAAKILSDSFKEKQRPQVRVFVVADHIHTAADLDRLANLPSREILLSQLVSAVESPLTAVVGSLDAMFRDLVGSIDALAEKRKAS